MPMLFLHHHHPVACSSPYPLPRRGVAVLMACVLLGVGGCVKDNPQVSLEAAVQQLQDNLEARNRSAVNEQLHARFQAQGALDVAWANQTMALVFLRHAQVRVIAPVRSSRVDAQLSHVGYTEAQVLLTGAQGLIPDRVAPYAVDLEWRREGGDWKLIGLRWQ